MEHMNKEFSSERYKNGHYLAAGRWYPENDLFGYPDTLIRARTNFAYQAGCSLISDGHQTAEVIADIGSCHGHGIKTIQEILSPLHTLSLDRWYEFLYAQKNVMHPQPEFTTMNLPHIPLKDACCDAVFLIHVIEHLPDLPTQLKEIRRILKPDGMLIVATPDIRNLVWTNPDDLDNFDDNKLVHTLQSAGFESSIYSICGDKHALAVHKRKKMFARVFPLTQKLRKYIPWTTWDKFLLSGGLTNTNFRIESQYNPDAIDLLAIAKKD